MVQIAGAVTVVFGLSLVAFAVLIIANPGLAKRWLGLFASSARAHYTEQVVRLLVGAAMAVFAPSMVFSQLFKTLAWLIVITAIILLLLPWRWHNQFAAWAIPLATRHLKLYAVGAFGLGVFILYGILGPVWF